MEIANVVVQLCVLEFRNKIQKGKIQKSKSNTGI